MKAEIQVGRLHGNNPGGNILCHSRSGEKSRIHSKYLNMRNLMQGIGYPYNGIGEE